MYRSLGRTRRPGTLTAAAADFSASFSAAVAVSGCPGEGRQLDAIPAKPIVIAPLIGQGEWRCHVSREDGLVNRSIVDGIVLMVSVVLRRYNGRSLLMLLLVLFSGTVDIGIVKVVETICRSSIH